MSYLTATVMPLVKVQKPPYTIESPGYQPVEGETVPRRHPKAKNGLLERPAEGIDTVWDLLQWSVKKYGDEPAVASRRLVKTHKEMRTVPKVVDGETREVQKEWTFFELSPYESLTYREYQTLVLQVASGLRHLGLQPNDRIHLFAGTSAHWLAMSHACSSQSIGLVTAYDTLGESGVEHSLLQSEAKAMYLDPHLLKTATGPLKKAGSVKIAIYNDSSTFEVPSKVIDEFKAAHPELTILSFEELRALGEKNSADPIPPKPDDLYCIMYTSGTGGLPKGVPVTHAGLVASVAGVHACVQECVTQADFILAYLPLAHIFEMMMENLVLFVGATLGYGNPRTLADSSMRNCPGDMRAFRPTILVGVPQIYETIKKGIISRVDGSGLLTRNLFWGAFNLKTFLVRHGLPLQGALDGVVFGKVRASTGGRLRFLMNGASGISADTQYFLSLVVGPMINGYGLTETCGTGALGSPLQWTSSAVGPIPAAVEVKLVSLPELGYSTARDPPQGEILIRGLPVAREYYRNAEETAKAWTADGWFRTGDVGEFDAEGHMRVVDRVKNLVKMQGGEYVALEKLEAVYRSAAVVQAVMVEASAEYPRAVAVVSPNEKVLAGMAAALSVDEHNARHDKSVNAAVLKELLAHGRKAGLSGMEMVAGVLVVEEEWTPASGYLTSTQKLNRRAIRDRWKKDIQQTFVTIQ